MQNVRKFEQTELTKIIIDALMVAIKSCEEFSFDKKSLVRFEKLLNHIEKEKLDVTLYPRE